MIYLHEKNKLKNILAEKTGQQVTRNSLRDWFLKKQDEKYNNKLYNNLALEELFAIAIETGIDIVDYKKKVLPQIKIIEKLEEENEEIPASRKNLVKLYWKEKNTITEIAKKLDMTRDQVYTMMKKYKVPFRKREFTREQIEGMYYNYTLDEMCKKLNVSKTTIYKHLKKYEIEMLGSGRRKRKSKEVM